MAIQLQTAREQLLLRKKDLTDVSQDTFVQWSNDVCDFLYKRLRGTDPKRFTDSSNTYTVTSDPQTSALPSYFKDVQEYETGFFGVDQDGKDTEYRLAITGPGRRDQGYYIKGSNVIFTGIDNGTVFRLRYIPRRTRFTAQTDYFTLDGLSTGTEIIPEWGLQNLVDALDVRYNIWDEEPGAESLADFRFVRSLNDLLDEFRTEPSAYQITDFTSLY